MQPTHRAPHWGTLTHTREQGAAQPRALAWLAQQLACPVQQLHIVRDGHGRPCLQVDVDGDGIGDIDLNWSHGGELLLLAMGQGMRVGIDVEPLRLRRNALAIARRYFHPTELRWLQDADAQGQRDQVFLRIWCAKEALLKAHGRGIAFGLHRFAVGENAQGQIALLQGGDGLHPDDGWQLQELSPAQGYHAALAWRARRASQEG